MARGAAFGPWPGKTSGGAVTSVATTDPLLTVAPTTGDILVSQKLGATWGAVGSTRFFACDTTNGNDANVGFSDVDQAHAGAVAVKTIAKLLTIVPKFGYGRNARVAIRSGNYASDTVVDLSGFIGYQNLLFIGTDTVPSAGAVAFTGDTNDTIAAGFTTAAGMNVAGYNPTSYVVAADGTPTVTLQLAGGGAPAFGAAPARPYGCRLRFDHATTTPQLQNKCFSIILAPTATTVIIGLPLGTNPVASDVCYIEMPNVTGPTLTLVGSSGQLNSQLQLVGFSLGQLRGTAGDVSIIGSETTRIQGRNLNITAFNTVINLPSFATVVVGTSVRTDLVNVQGGVLGFSDSAHTGVGGTFIVQEPQLFLWERSSAHGMIVYGGAHANGNNIIEEIGTNSSTNHGATCQIWAPNAATPGVQACGLAIYGGYQISRVKFSNMGAVPCVRVNGSNLGVTVQGISGGVADGNLDVGLDLSPFGLSGNTLGGMGCALALVGTPSATGSTGDVRLANGQIASWAELLATGMTDQAGNRIISASAPLKVVATLSGALITNAETPSTTDLGNPGFQPLLNANATPGVEYPTSLRLITRMRVAAPAGNGATPITVTLARRTGGVRTDTTMTVTIPALAGAWSVVSDLAHPQLFLDGDLFAVHADAVATGEGNIPVTVTLEGP